MPTDMSDDTNAHEATIREFHLALPGRDEIHLRLALQPDGRILARSVTGIGCPGLLAALVELRQNLQGPLAAVPVPGGSSHVALLARELVLRAKGEWADPWVLSEANMICNCRQISAQKIDQAIIGGCHTLDAVSRATSAGTSCGGCRPKIEDRILFRLKEPDTKK
jgi:bacterioferritin-associated ferredoxin